LRRQLQRLRDNRINSVVVSGAQGALHGGGNMYLCAHCSMAVVNVSSGSRQR
jgi:hypothetical protein